MEQATCSVDGCDRRPRSPRSALCNAHYFRQYRTGSTGRAEIGDGKRKPCSVDECDRLASGLGWCDMHYQRHRTHGDVTLVVPHATGPTHWAWLGDKAGYTAVHDRLRSTRGPASAKVCVRCGCQAMHWAYDHGDTAEKRSEYGPYSTDLDHYVGMCVPCHKSFDLDYLADPASCHAQRQVGPAA